MEEGQLQSDTQHPPQEDALQKGDQSTALASLHTSASAKTLSSTLDQGEMLTSVQEKGGSVTQCQAKLLWKPIPPLLPENQTKTKDQSCQTEEQNSTGSLGHNEGGNYFFTPSVALIHTPKDQNSPSLPEPHNSHHIKYGAP